MDCIHGSIISTTECAEVGSILAAPDHCTEQLTQKQRTLPRNQTCRLIAGVPTVVPQEQS